MKNQQFYNFTNVLLYCIIALFSCSLLTCNTIPPTDKPKIEKWIALFNGSSLENWTPKFAGYKSGVNYKNQFIVKDSLLSVRYAPQDTFDGAFGHLFYKEKFAYYRLQVTYRFIGEQLPKGPGWAYRNNGLMLHCQSPQSMELTQEFPTSLEMQLLGGNGKEERSNGNLCTPNSNVMMGDSLFTPHCVSSSSKTYHGDQWVTVEALVLGDSLIQHIVEGEVVLEYDHPTVGDGSVKRLADVGAALKDGYISIQAETHPIDFKSIRLLNLCGCMDEKAKNYKAYFVKADNSACKY